MDLLTRMLEGDATALDEAISSSHTESLELECKTKSDATKPELNKDDKRNLGKALSGFANSAGGTLLFGLDARANAEGIDCICDKKPIRQVGRFAEELRSLSATLVMPRLDSVDVRTFCVADDGSGYVAIRVDRSERRPHRSEADQRYYRRSGTNFFPMEHFEIEDAFARNTVAQLELHTRVARIGSVGRVHHYGFFLTLRNTSRIAARFPYVALEELRGARLDDSTFRYEARGLRRADFNRVVRLYGGADVIIHPGVDLEMCMMSLNYGTERNGTEKTINGQLPEEWLLTYRYSIGAENCPIVSGEHSFDLPTLLGSEWVDA